MHFLDNRLRQLDLFSHMAHDPEFAQRIEAVFTSLGVEYEAKKMFGGICYLVDGKMCVGEQSDRLMVRYDHALDEQILSRPGARAMDFTGKPMRGYAFVDRSHLADDRVLADWIDVALSFNKKAKASRKRVAKG